MSWFKKIFGTRREASISIESNLIIDSDNVINNNIKDNWEGHVLESDDVKPFHIHIGFSYKDGAGNVTKREIISKNYTRTYNGGMLYGHCKLRNANRSFWFSRMSSVYDADTGEIIENIRDYIFNEYAKTSAGKSEIFSEENEDFLTIIYFAGVCDGQFRKEEKLIIGKHVQDMIGAEMSTDDVDFILSNYDKPTERKFTIALNRVKKNEPEKISLIYEIANEIVATQKKVHPMEELMLKKIRDRL